jgi:hypothetical protein
MPIPVLGEVYFNGIQSIPFLLPVLKVLPLIALLVLLKTWFGGAKNANERVMHGRVAIVTVKSPSIPSRFRVCKRS